MRGRVSSSQMRLISFIKLQDFKDNFKCGNNKFLTKYLLFLKRGGQPKCAAGFGGCAQRPMIILARFFFGSFLLPRQKK